MSQDRVKVEDYSVRQGSTSVVVEIFVAREKQTFSRPVVTAGDFFANFANERVVAKTLAGVRSRLAGLIARQPVLEFRPVILIDVNKRVRDADDAKGQRNGFDQHGGGCSFTYMRCEIAESAPGKKGKRKTLWRKHVLDFEEEVAEARTRERRWHDKKAGDVIEASMRKKRQEMRDVCDAWLYDKCRTIPYTDESWAGLRRIVDGLLEVQRRLDAILVHDDVVKLLSKANGAPTLALPQTT
jgi:hypothetical protein